MPFPSSNLYPSSGLYPSDSTTGVWTSSFGEALYNDLEPWQNDDLATYLEGVGAMFEELYSLVYDKGVDGDDDYVPGWGALLDPALCPTNALPYLAQYVGVQIPQGTQDQAARQMIVGRAGQNRGTVSAIYGAVYSSISQPWQPNHPYTTGGQLVSYGIPTIYYQVNSNFTSGPTFTATHLTPVDITTQDFILERYNGVTGTFGDPYQFTVVVRPGQLSPAGNTTAIRAAINKVKPGGVMFTIVLSDSPIWSSATKTWTGVASSVTWAGTSTGQV